MKTALCMKQLAIEKEKQNREKFIIVTYATVNFMHELHAVIVIIEHEMSTNLHDSDVGHQISDQTLLLGFHHLMEENTRTRIQSVLAFERTSPVESEAWNKRSLCAKL